MAANDWNDVMTRINPFSLASTGSAFALTLCVIGAAWCVFRRTPAFDLCASLSRRMRDGYVRALYLQGYFHHRLHHLGRISQSTPY
jgi:hypothetical protein